VVATTGVPQAGIRRPAAEAFVERRHHGDLGRLVFRRRSSAESFPVKATRPPSPSLRTRSGAKVLEGAPSSTIFRRTFPGRRVMASSNSGPPSWGRPYCPQREGHGASGEFRSPAEELRIQALATLRIRSPGTPKSRSISRAVSFEEVSTRSQRRMTLPCMRRG